MPISGRDVARRLAGDCGLHRVQVRALLAAGLAGEPIKVGRTHLYDDQLVDDLARRRVMADREIEDACARGPFIARVGSGRAFHVTASWEQQAARLAGTARQRRLRFQFERPAGWFAPFENRRICLGPGYPFLIAGTQGTTGASPSAPQA